MPTPTTDMWLEKLTAIEQEEHSLGQLSRHIGLALAGRCWHLSTLFENVLDGTLSDILVVPAEPLFMAWEYSGSGLATFSLYENPQDSGGILLTPRNANREIGDDYPPLSAWRDVGTSDPGNLLEADILPGGGSKISSGGSGTNAAGFLLAPHIPYLLRLVNMAGEPASFAISLRCFVE